MKGYLADIETLTEENTDFRKVLYTGHNLQLVLMSLTPGQDIGMETHATHDQFFRIEKGHGEVVIDGVRHKIKGGDALVVPAGAKHNVPQHRRQALATLYDLRPAQPRRQAGREDQGRRRGVTRGL